MGAGRLYKPLEEQVGKTLHEIFSQVQADEFLGYIHQVLGTQQVLTIEYSSQMAGQQIWFSTRIAPIRHDQVIGWHETSPIANGLKQPRFWKNATAWRAKFTTH